MSKTVYEVKAIVGRYTDRDGKEKSRYQHIGKIIETRRGLMMVLNMIPIVEGGWSGWSYLNKPAENEQYQGLPKDESNDDEVPF